MVTSNYDGVVREYNELIADLDLLGYAGLSLAGGAGTILAVLVAGGITSFLPIGDDSTDTLSDAQLGVIALLSVGVALGLSTYATRGDGRMSGLQKASGGMAIGAFSTSVAILAYFVLALFVDNSRLSAKAPFNALGSSSPAPAPAPAPAQQASLSASTDDGPTEVDPDGPSADEPRMPNDTPATHTSDPDFR